MNWLSKCVVAGVIVGTAFTAYGGTAGAMPIKLHSAEVPITTSCGSKPGTWTYNYGTVTTHDDGGQHYVVTLKPVPDDHQMLTEQIEVTWRVVWDDGAVDYDTVVVHRPNLDCGTQATTSTVPRTTVPETVVPTTAPTTTLVTLPTTTTITTTPGAVVSVQRDIPPTTKPIFLPATGSSSEPVLWVAGAILIIATLLIVAPIIDRKRS